MIAWLKTLDLDIEATAENPLLLDKLPEIVAEDVHLGTLNPHLRKFLSLIDRRQTDLEELAQHMQTLPKATQELRFGEIARLNAEVSALMQIFWIETADDLSRTTSPNMWGKDLFFSVKKAWQVTGIPPHLMEGHGNSMVFVAVGDPENMDELQDEWPETPPPSKKQNKRRLN